MVRLPAPPIHSARAREVRSTLSLGATAAKLVALMKLPEISSLLATTGKSSHQFLSILVAAFMGILGGDRTDANIKINDCHELEISRLAFHGLVRLACRNDREAFIVK